MNYYYLIASLPRISMEEPPPMGINEFRAVCAEHLQKSDLRDLDELINSSTGKPHSSFAVEWTSFETMLRNSIARTRAARLRKDASEFIRETAGYDSSIDKAVSDAYAKSSPLERELALDRFRWERAEELAGLSPFLGRVVLAYAVRLLLSVRWSEMSDEEGGRRAEELISGGMNKEPIAAE